jgi:hypothetical protein
MFRARHGWKSPETRLVLAACRGSGIPNPAEVVDWDALLEQAVAWRVAPLVYRGLKQAPGLAPQPTLALLRRQYAVTAASNLRQFHLLEAVLRAFAERSIPVMLLKGAALVRLAYRDPGLRPMGDVDLLVRREDLRRAADALLSHGLAPVLPGREEQYERDHHHWAPFKTPDLSLVMELHHDLAAPGSSVQAVIDGVWRRAQPVAGTGAPALAPSASDLVLHQCVHTSSHALFYPLLTLCDLTETVRAATGIDWDGLAETAREWNASRQAFCFLSLTEDLLAPGIPARLLDRLRASAGFHHGEPALLLGLARGMAFQREADRRAPGWIREEAWKLAVAPSGMGRKIARMTRILWRGVLQSARAERPDLPLGAARWYAATVHPFALLRRRMPAARKPTHGNSDARTPD